MIMSTSTRTTAIWIIAILWVIAGLSCFWLVEPLSRNFPDVKEQLIQQLIDTFATPAIGMLAFLYVNRRRVDQSMKADMIDLIAVILCFVYLWPFVYYCWHFNALALHPSQYQGSYNADALLTNMIDIRRYTAF